MLATAGTDFRIATREEKRSRSDWHTTIPGRGGRRHHYQRARLGRNHWPRPTVHVCGAAHTFEEANKLVQHHRPDVLLIEPFLESRDAIRWIKDLAAEFPRIRILVVTRQSELTYAERALHAGASGYWMKNSSVKELMHAIETVLAGEIYASRAITAGVMRKFAGGRNLPPGLDVLSNREIAVFGLIAAKHGVGEIAKNSALAAKRSRVTANTSKRSSVIAMPKNSSAARASC